MTIDRRSLIAGVAALPGAALVVPAGAQTAVAPGTAGQGLDAAQFGVRAGADADQSRALQKAIDQAAARHAPLWLAPGLYKASGLTLPPGAQLSGIRGQTRFVLGQGAALFSASRADGVTLTGLVLDGGNIQAPGDRRLVYLANGKSVLVGDCEFHKAAGMALMLEGCSGQVTGNLIDGAAVTALFTLDARGLVISGNTIRNSGNGGIRVWQSEKRDDGTIVADNRIDDTAAGAGGSGQNGNAINVYRAGKVIVRGNQIRNAAFSAVRGNASSGIQIVGNSCTAIGEVALYSEFDFEGAAITGNTVDGAGIGVSVTNFKEGGRLGTVQGNILRNITTPRPMSDPGEGYGIGIGVEADTAVTGNVIENAAKIGIAAGTGPYLRDVTVTGNVVRNVPLGIAVSVAKGAGAAVVSHNLITGARRGAVVGMEWDKIVTADLVLVAPGAYPQITVSGNQVR